MHKSMHKMTPTTKVMVMKTITLANLYTTTLRDKLS